MGNSGFFKMKQYVPLQKIFSFCAYSMRYETVLTLYVNGRLESVYFLHSLIFWSRFLWPHAQCSRTPAQRTLAFGAVLDPQRPEASRSGPDRRLAQLSWRRGKGGGFYLDGRGTGRTVVNSICWNIYFICILNQPSPLQSHSHTLVYPYRLSWSHLVSIHL